MDGDSRDLPNATKARCRKNRMRNEPIPRLKGRNDDYSMNMKYSETKCRRPLSAALASTFACMFGLLAPVSAFADGKDESPAGADRHAQQQSAAPAVPKLPGIEINLVERSVDVDANVCLHEGMLELIACRKGTKEHESIVTINAEAKHIHLGLLLLGAGAGNPAMIKRLDDSGNRWAEVPSRGDAIDVFLVFKDTADKLVEEPISRFLKGADGKKFPSHTFIFAGSRLVRNGDKPPKYACDSSGNVISIATFGDELLCLPGTHSEANSALEWKVDATRLPKVGSAVTLRLRPQTRKEKQSGAASPPRRPLRGAAMN